MQALGILEGLERSQVESRRADTSARTADPGTPRTWTLHGFAVRWKRLLAKAARQIAPAQTAALALIAEPRRDPALGGGYVYAQAFIAHARWQFILQVQGLPVAAVGASLIRMEEDVNSLNQRLTVSTGQPEGTAALPEREET